MTQPSHSRNPDFAAGDAVGKPISEYPPDDVVLKRIEECWRKSLEALHR